MIIYKVTNLINNKIYIGKSIETLKKRKYMHLWLTKHAGNHYFHRAIRKYGEENFAWEIIDRCLFAESLIALERHYIKLFKCKFPNGYNLTDGGEGLCGHKFTDEHKCNIAKSMKGKKHSLETRAKMSASKKNMSSETRAKMSANRIGRKHSPEQRAKISISLMGNQNRKGSKCSIDTRKKISISLKKTKAQNINKL